MDLNVINGTIYPRDASGQSRPFVIPHPLECIRIRPQTGPRWEPRRETSDSIGERSRRSVLEGWHSPTVIADPGCGAVRINFTYRNWYTTNAAFAFKPRRTQYTEGPHEAATLRILETDVDTIDFQFQPIAIHWKKSNGQLSEYTPDGLKETLTGLTIFENKASWAYFNEPDTADKLERAEHMLADLGVGFERIVGTKLMDPMRLQIVRDVFDDRATPIETRHLDAASELFEKDGGSTTLGQLHAVLSKNRYHARAVANALLVRRKVGFRLNRPPVQDTIVSLPEQPRMPGRLRRFLSDIASQEAI